MYFKRYNNMWSTQREVKNAKQETEKLMLSSSLCIPPVLCHQKRMREIQNVPLKGNTYFIGNTLVARLGPAGWCAGGLR